ncbi:hypothetical protein [Paenibacillus herberti]|uniref:Uncharacterized protein n=1 Tax=Paenibacillus herberti TaxID=1619309 RepID=A0A229P664_9BACL|nr:hypothetical protein [Paenibacillus herberti]OXM17329.1 hypothetical protein CGZ75_12205 [Paenibacillus herberti]
MAKPLKIEQLGLQHIVAAGIKDGKNPQQIAAQCSKEAEEPISNMAVRRYLETLEVSKITPAQAAAAPVSTKVPVEQKQRIVRKDPERVTKLIDRDIDLIELQFRTTQALADRFDWIADLPDMFERRMIMMRDMLKDDGVDVSALDSWGIGFTLELRRNIGTMTALNRELRENARFMATLREKAFEFSLIQEYLSVFMDIFRQENAEAYEIAETKIAANPRLQRIVEQQQQMRGYENVN